MRSVHILLGSAIIFLSLMLRDAQAYIGPGAGLTVIGTVIAFVGAVLLLLIGFVWYPIKRLRARLKNSKKPAQIEEESGST